MRKKSTKSYIITNPSFKEATSTNIQLLRILITPAHTRIDFGYQATEYYIKGGWVRMFPETFILNQKTGEKLGLEKAEGIPLSPIKHEFKTTIDWLYYSLYFPPILLQESIIDIIESEKETENNFNFYGVKISPKVAFEVVLEH